MDSDTQNIVEMVAWGASSGLGAAFLVYFFSFCINQVKNLIKIITL